MLEYLKIDNHFKKYLPIFMIMLSLVLLMGTSYALLRSSQQGENPYVMNVGLLEVTFQDSETNALTVENMVPVTDEEGMKIDKELEFTVKNTGTLPAKYNIYIEETSTTPEFKSVIRFISNKDDTGYNAPKTLSENNFIDNLATLDVGESVTYKVKVWLAEEADSTYMDKTFTARVVIDAIQGNAPAMAEIQRTIAKSTCNPSVTDDDGTIYLSGTNDCVNFNYVWYSGKLWRITALYPDGTMKMITDDAITTINWGSKSTVSSSDLTSAYDTSYMREWLNQEFLPTLNNYEDIIVEDAGWYSITDTANSPTKPTGEYTLTDPVGLLNVYEYYMSYKNTSYTNGYLQIGYYWWLITPYSFSNVRYVYTDGGIQYNGNSSSNGYSARPSVNLKSTIQLVGGSGTVSDPYRIKGDQDNAKENVTLLNTRQSGEYVKLSSDETAPTFRIVGTELVGENLTTKIVLNDYVKDTNDVDADSDTTEVLRKYFTSSSSYELWTEVDKTNTTYWRGYLNNTWIKEIDNTYNETDGTSSILEKGTYYLGYHTTESYKTSVCSSVSSDVSVRECIENGTVVTNTSSEDYVGLLRVGEMFASQFGAGTSSSSNMWLITPYNSSIVRTVNNYGNLNLNNPFTITNSARPSVNLKSEIVIKSGEGSKNNPFLVGLPSSE